ncbi:MAG TPA: zinc ribbon domain-containing protein [Candidatus Binatia bacterium]|nr:zinc ribbon domain-containing protein [Candidatus Binatia bacterium]
MGCRSPRWSRFRKITRSVRSPNKKEPKHSEPENLPVRFQTGTKAMPIFEYQCCKCKYRFETIVLSAREKITCPECQSSAVDKQLSVFRSPASDREASASGVGCGCTPQTCGCR